MFNIFRGFLKRWKRRGQDGIELFELLEGTDLKPMRFWMSPRQGSTVSVAVRDPNGEKLELLLQRKLTPSDLKDGKLLPVAWSTIKHRGGKRLSGMTLSLESAEALHAVLGRALKDARQKHRRRVVSDRLLNLFMTYYMTHIESRAKITA
jgi:hypothetical protein